MGNVNDLTHWRSRVKQIETHTDRVELDAATRKLIADLIRRIEQLEARGTGPTVEGMMPEHVARIEALEDHATAQIELASVLQLCLEMARESEARTARLEKEARNMNETISTVVPMLQVAMIRG